MNRRLLLVLAGVTLLVAACAPADNAFSPVTLPTPTPASEAQPVSPATVEGAGDVTPGPQADDTSPIEGAIYNKVQIGEWDRRYHVVVPDSYDPATPTPVLFGFHGRGQDAHEFSLESRLTSFGQEHGIILVYPESVFESGYWALNDGMDRLDDLAFVDYLLDDLSATYNVDPDRIYATGLSNGGFFVQRLACERADRFAAVASVAATIDVDAMAACAPSRPIPVMLFNGTADRNVFWNGSDTGYTSVPELFDHWMQLDGCTEGPNWTDLPDTEDDHTTTRRATATGCDGGVEVVLMSIEGGGHTWPGGAPFLIGMGVTALDFSANQVMWDFFTDHPR